MTEIEEPTQPSTEYSSAMQAEVDVQETENGLLFKADDPDFPSQAYFASDVVEKTGAPHSFQPMTPIRLAYLNSVNAKLQKVRTDLSLVRAVTGPLQNVVVYGDNSLSFKTNELNYAGLDYIKARFYGDILEFLEEEERQLQMKLASG